MTGVVKIEEWYNRTFTRLYELGRFWASGEDISTLIVNDSLNLSSITDSTTVRNQIDLINNMQYNNYFVGGHCQIDTGNTNDDVYVTGLWRTGNNPNANRLHQEFDATPDYWDINAQGGNWAV